MNDLMPGNYIKHKESDCEMLTAYQLQKYKEFLEGGRNIPRYYRTLEGIPITEEWLILLGFVQTMNGLFQKVIEKTETKPYYIKEVVLTYSDLDKNIYLDIVYFDKIQKMDTEEHFHQMPHIKYVHQIQNLYLMLTGTMLKYQEERTHENSE